MADQHGAWATGAYGHPFVRTPNLDALARRSATFDAAYCASPICVPSRASLATGLRVQRTAVWDNGVPLRSDLPTWAHYLSLAGYQTVLTGKHHFMGPDQLHGFETRLGGEVHNVRIQPGGSYRADPTFDLMSWFRAGPGRMRYEDFDDEIEDHAIRFLEGEGRDSSRPFAIQVSFIRPHFPLVADPDLWNVYWPDLADLPPLPDGYFDRVHPAWLGMRRYYKGDRLSDEQIRRARAGYYALVTRMDRRIGNVLGALDRAGLAESTVILYTSDHGEHVGGHGLWWKSTFFEESARVPLMIAWPGVTRGGERRGDVVSHVDVTATLLDVAGASPVEPLDGRSARGLLAGRDPSWPDEALSEYYTSGATAPRCMLRHGRYKLNAFLDARPELYDLATDPGEWNDLAQEPGHAGLVADLLDRVRELWDGEALGQKVEESQARRRLILQAESVYRGGLPHPAT